MKLGYVMTSEPGATDRLLADLAARLAVKGLRAAEIVQRNTECTSGVGCDMDVQVLPDGELIRISQSLGPQSRGCRLNPEALERAVAQVTNSLSGDPLPDLLLVNKFGKHEADGRGMRPVIAEALGLGLPVVCGVNRMNVEAFMRFSEGLAEALEPREDRLAQWVEAALTQAAD